MYCTIINYSWWLNGKDFVGTHHPVIYILYYYKLIYLYLLMRFDLRNNVLTNLYKILTVREN